jgi:transposase
VKTVVDIQVIRRLYELEGWSERRIARELHLSRRTVHKYLNREEETEEPAYKRKGPPLAVKMGVYQETVDEWLVEDASAPEKQRHTAHRIWTRLQEEEAATGLSESTVRHFVARRRRALALSAPKVFLHLEFLPGDVAQVDWGEANVIIGGQTVKAWMFCMRLGCSTASFVALYPHGRMEAFLDGHIRAFQFFGGVTRHIIYDNLKSAVIRILHGRGRKLNQRFETLAAHYLFEPIFANVAAGWEKGLVENLVGSSRRNYLVPVPQADSLEAINRDLVRRLLAERAHVANERGGTTVGELWDAERAEFIPLPLRSFRPSTSWAVHVSHQATVRHQKVQYSVPAALVGLNLRLEAFYDHVEIYDGASRVARHALGVPGQPPVLELDHYLDVLLRKPGGVRNARVVNELGKSVTAYREAFLKVRPDAFSAFVQILFLSRRYTHAAVLAGITKARTERVYDVERVEALIAATLAEPLAPAGESAVAQGPAVQQPSLAAYDRLMATSEVSA